MTTSDRRHFLQFAFKFGMAATSSVLWSNRAIAAAISAAGSTSGYKAVVLVTLAGGNDGNNMIVPMDTHQYSSYASIRGSLALSQSHLLPLRASLGDLPYGLHSALPNVAALYNAGKGIVVANVGPLPRPAAKSDILTNRDQFPGSHESHPEGIAQWESAQVGTTGWGGRMAEYLLGQSGVVPPVLTTANSMFDVGRSVQAVAIQNGAAFTAIPPELNTVVKSIANAESSASNLLTQQAAKARVVAMSDQQVLDQAANYRILRTSFGTSRLSQGLKKIAQIIAGQSVTAANRQMFYVQHGSYDHHVLQLSLQNAQLSDFDQSIGSFFTALSEIGAQDQVMVITHSDFSRTLQPNNTGGTDHAWGNHHLMLGGGIAGGRIAGKMPDMTLGTSQDLSGLGMWIPTQSVVQMTAGVAGWMGLNDAQIADVFPDLVNFPSGATRLV